LTWEDIRDLKGKMILTFIAALHEVSLLECFMKKEKNLILDNMKTNVGLDD